MNHELKMATSDLANFLQEKLPELSDQWWQEHVVERLSFQQQRVVGEKKITVLRELDFAALLRILDQNWYDLSKKSLFRAKQGIGLRSYKPSAIGGRIWPRKKHRQAKSIVMLTL